MRPYAPTLLLLAVACEIPAPADDYAAVLPGEEILVDLPPAQRLRAASGEPSEFQAVTEQAATDVNTLIGDVLDGIGHITSFDPTFADEAQSEAVWGPWSDDGVDGMLYVKHFEEDGHYEWALQSRLTGQGEEDWLPIVAGHVDAGATEDTGSGWFALDLDAIARLDPEEPARGLFVSRYDVTVDRVEASAALEGFSEDGGATVADVVYDYAQDADGGYMDLVFEADITGNEIGEFYILRTRWADDGAGRGDAYVTGGDLGPLVYKATECWDAGAIVAFHENNADFTRSGDDALCVFDEPEWNDEAPE